MTSKINSKKDWFCYYKRFNTFTKMSSFTVSNHTICTYLYIYLVCNWCTKVDYKARAEKVCKYIVTAVHIRLSQSHFLTDFLNFKAWFILKVLDLCFCKYVFDKTPKIFVGGYRQHLHIWVDSKNQKTSLNCSIFDQERSVLQILKSQEKRDWTVTSKLFYVQ